MADQQIPPGLLRPCPHCGCDDTPRVLCFRGKSVTWFQVVCAAVVGGCGAAGPRAKAPGRKATDEDNWADATGYWPNLDDDTLDAVSLWNARASDQTAITLQAKVADEAAAHYLARLAAVLAPCPN